MLHEFVAAHRSEIILRCRAKSFGRAESSGPILEIDHGVPLFLNQLTTALRLEQSGSAEISHSAVLNGLDLWAQGLTVAQVVYGYGDVCQSITELASETDAVISPNDFRLLNGCLDAAVAAAVTQHGRERDKAPGGSHAEVAQENERRGFFAHEMRDLIHTVTTAFAVVKSGAVGASGSTGQIIDRALLRAGDLISRSLAEVRLGEGGRLLQEFPVAEFVDELVAAGRLESNARGLRLIVAGDGCGARIKADRPVLATALMNLLQNALKFTHPGSTVTVCIGATEFRVVIEIQDECGGLPASDIEQLFHTFQQRNQNRTGLGLGLVFTRQVVEAIGGLVSARDLPGSGCVFSVDLPRVIVAAPESVMTAHQR
jgi:signal transduction histidine kinase